MTEVTPDQTLLNSIIRKVSLLEDHLMTLLHRSNPFSLPESDKSAINKLMSIYRNPLQIDDRTLTRALKEMENNLQKFVELTKEFDIRQTLSEIKYIGNRLKNIEQSIDEIKKDGIKRKIQCHFSIDGIEDISEKEVEKEKNEDVIMNDLLSILDERQKFCVIHRNCLFGKNKLKFKEIASKFNISEGRAREIYRNAIYKFHPYHNKNIKKILYSDIKNDFINQLKKTYENYFKSC